MKVGDLVKIREPEKQAWLKHNPWMAFKWGLDTVFLVIDERSTTTAKPVKLFKIIHPNTGDIKWAKPEELEVVSEKR
tara:strand:- start:910 stop:1140 length:231 start_codon:yes stop_codon:yes gene_type:complete